MKKLLPAFSIFFLSYVYLIYTFYYENEKLGIAVLLSTINFLVGLYLAILIGKKNNTVFMVFLLMSFYMFFIKGLLMYINYDFSIYYNLKLQKDSIDYLNTYIVMISFYLVIILAYGSVSKKKIQIQKIDLKEMTVKYNLLTIITFIAIVGKYFFSIKFNYGLPGKIPSGFPMAGIGGLIYFFLSEIVSIGLIYLFILINRKKNRYYTVIIILLFILHFTLSAMNGIKGESTYLIINVLIYYFFLSNKKISSLHMVSLMGIGIVFFTVADRIRNSVALSKENFNLLEMVITIVRRSTGFDSLFNILNYYGSGIYSIYLSPIEPIRFFTTSVVGVPENAISAAAPSFFGYFLIKNGYFITLCLCALFGFFLKLIDTYLKRKLLTSRDMIFMVLYLETVMFISNFFFEGNVIVALKKYFVAIIVISILNFIKIADYKKII